MDEVLEILRDLQPELDFSVEKHLIDDHLLSSLSILSLVAQLEDTFGITIPAVEIVPRNFNSADAIYELVQRLEEEG